MMVTPAADFLRHDLAPWQSSASRRDEHKLAQVHLIVTIAIARQQAMFSAARDQQQRNLAAQYALLNRHQLVLALALTDYILSISCRIVECAEIRTGIAARI